MMHCSSPDELYLLHSIGKKDTFDMTSKQSLISLEDRLRHIIDSFAPDDWNANVRCFENCTVKPLLTITRRLFYRISAC